LLQRLEPGRYGCDGLAYLVPGGQLFLGSLGQDCALALAELDRLFEACYLRLRLFGFPLDELPNVLVDRELPAARSTSK
jgi:hypothetical protein